MSSNTRRNFATLQKPHQKIAKTFYENIEYTHPETISSDGQGCRWFNEDNWYSSCVKYYTYTGPNIRNI